MKTLLIHLFLYPFLYLALYPPLQIVWRAACSRERPIFSRRTLHFAYSWFWLPAIVLAVAHAVLATWWWCTLIGALIVAIPGALLYGKHFKAKWIRFYALTGACSALCCWCIVRLIAG